MTPQLHEIKPKELAEKMFNEVYSAMPDATTWMPNTIVVHITKKILRTTINNVLDFNPYDEQRFIYWQQVINHIEQLKQGDEE